MKKQLPLDRNRWEFIYVVKRQSFFEFENNRSYIINQKANIRWNEKTVKNTYPAYCRIVTLVCSGTIRDKARTSVLYIRMQPCETRWPIEPGLFVP